MCFCFSLMVCRVLSRLSGVRLVLRVVMLLMKCGWLVGLSGLLI